MKVDPVPQLEQIPGTPRDTGEQFCTIPFRPQAKQRRHFVRAGRGDAEDARGLRRSGSLTS
jgi:hypothetical protein